jgi:hypothetical protein
MRLLPLLTVALFPLDPANAETPLTAQEFADYIASDTISYGYNTGTRGTADYGPDQSLIWAFEDGQCFNGQWYPRGEDICFAYEDGRLSACWRFTLGPDGLEGIATERASGNLEPLIIFETSRSPDPLVCFGPEVGV